MRHFIRGCWDGDGSVFFSDGKLGASYVSGSLEFIKTLVDELYKMGIYRTILRGFLDSKDDFASLRSKYPHGQYPLKIYIEKRSKAPTYNLKIASKDNLINLFHYFYDGIDESLFLRQIKEI